MKTIHVLKKIILFTITILILFGIKLSEAQKKEEMIWLQQDAEPYFVSSGKYKGHGLFEVVQKIIQKKMPEYGHKTLTLPQKRLFREFRTSKKVCAVAVVRTPERERYMYFTIPTVFLVPHKITILKDNWRLFRNRKEISLNTLLEDASLTLGITAGRSYGNVIDAILAKYKGQPNIHPRHGSLYADLFEMLLLGRIQYIIGYPTEYMFSAKTLGVEDKVMSLTIKENKAYIFGVAGLPKNEWGKTMVNKINAILSEERRTPAYRRLMEFWQDIQPDNTAYRKDYEQLFLD